VRKLSGKKFITAALKGSFKRRRFYQQKWNDDVVSMALLILMMSGVLVVIDQLLKIWMLGHLAGSPSIMIIPGLLQLTYVENRGAAFGIFQGKVGILSVLTLAVIITAIILLLMGKFKPKMVLWSVGLIIAGGTGNLIDRMFRTFVVDYLDISPWFNFPVFNFADCCVVIGTSLLLIYLLFFEGKESKKLPEQADGEEVG
jgi:signal peptidase II